ncbi:MULTISPECIES: hypothetical protein [unclassified Streptomyces]|nr:MULTISPECIES: hypothetical protein [unclassified Streptomyces]
MHLGDCLMIEGTFHPIAEHDARVALTDSTIEPGVFWTTLAAPAILPS